MVAETQGLGLLLAALPGTLSEQPVRNGEARTYTHTLTSDGGPPNGGVALCNKHT